MENLTELFTLLMMTTVMMSGNVSVVMNTKIFCLQSPADKKLKLNEDVAKYNSQFLCCMHRF